MTDTTTDTAAPGAFRNAETLSIPATSNPAPRRVRGTSRTARSRVTKAGTRRAVGARHAKQAADQEGRPSFAEFFAGSGAVKIAMEAAGFACGFANDFDPRKQDAYVVNFPGSPLDGQSIAEVTARDLPHDIQGVTGSSPCQDFSMLGTRQGFEGTRSIAAFELIRIIGERRAQGDPLKYVVFENVVGLLSSRDGKDFALLCEALVSQGYVVGGLLLEAGWFLPQMRERVILVAARDDLVIPRHLVARGPTEEWHEDAMRRAHARLPLAVHRAWRWWRMPAPPPRRVQFEDVLEQDAGGWLPEWRLRQINERLCPEDRERIEAARKAGIRWGVTMRKGGGGKGVDGTCRQLVTFDGLFRCITKNEGRDNQQVIEVLPGGWRVRPLTGRERARLMGLPDDYVLPTQAATAMALTGDAVVVPAYEWVARHLLLPLAQAEVGERRPRPLPRRARGAIGRILSRPIKGLTRRIEAQVPPETKDILAAEAAEAGLPLARHLMALLNRERAMRGVPPLPGHVPERPEPRKRPGSHERRRARVGARPEPVLPVDGDDDPPKLPPAPGRRGGGARGRVQARCTPLRYPGGKAKVASRLVRELGATSCLVEPFGGSAAVSVRAILTGMADRAVIAERDDGLRTLWQVVASAPDAAFRALLEEVEGAQPSGDWWAAFLRRVHGDPSETLVAARALLAGRFRWGGIAGGGLRPDGHLADALRAGAMVQRLLAIRAQRHRLSIRDDAMEVIREFAPEVRAKFFVDPPYTIGTTQAGRRLYTHHEVDHRAVMDALARVRGRVLATYPDDSEVHRLAGEHGFQVQPLGIRDGHRRARQELLLVRGVGPP